jgi:hypothetical protein
MHFGSLIVETCFKQSLNKRKARTRHAVTCAFDFEFIISTRAPLLIIHVHRT